MVVDTIVVDTIVVVANAKFSSLKLLIYEPVFMP